MRIPEIEILELQNIPIAAAIQRAGARTVRLLEIKTDDGITGISRIGGLMHSATIAFIPNELAPFLKGKDPLETERLMHQMMWKFDT